MYYQFYKNTYKTLKKDLALLAFVNKMQTVFVYTKIKLLQPLKKYNYLKY